MMPAIRINYNTVSTKIIKCSWSCYSYWLTWVSFWFFHTVLMQCLIAPHVFAAWRSLHQCDSPQAHFSKSVAEPTMKNRYNSIHVSLHSQTEGNQRTDRKYKDKCLCFIDSNKSTFKSTTINEHAQFSAHTMRVWVICVRCVCIQCVWT